MLTDVALSLGLKSRLRYCLLALQIQSDTEIVQRRSEWDAHRIARYTSTMAGPATTRNTQGRMKTIIGRVSKMAIGRTMEFTMPNKIAASDFDGWVQERGLYFADTWDDHYRPLLFQWVGRAEEPQT